MSMAVSPSASLAAPRPRGSFSESPVRKRLVMSGVALLSVVVLGACQINWQANKNFGVAVEPTAARISLAIYRVPRSLLYSVLYSAGPGAVADIIYAKGNGPLSKLPQVCVGSVCIGASSVKSLWHFLIYQRLGDLTEALVNAQNHADCLDLTLISYSQFAPNWTHKSVGCANGAL